MKYGCRTLHCLSSSSFYLVFHPTLVVTGCCGVFEIGCGSRGRSPSGLTCVWLPQYIYAMKRVALFVCLAYGAVFCALTWPVVWVVFFPGIPMKDCMASYHEWAFWILLGVLVVCQAGLLLIPVRVTSLRPVSRRHIALPLLVTGFLIGALVLGTFSALNEAVLGEAAFGAKWARWCALGVGVAVWITWSVVFYRLTRRNDPKSVILRQCQFLLRGSVITLLVAVPTHILARWRGYCCAGFYTFVGITFGIAVMLACFGPAVYFLYAERWRKLHP